MTSRNNITGDLIKSKSISAEGRANWDEIFKKKTNATDTINPDTISPKPQCKLIARKNRKADR